MSELLSLIAAGRKPVIGMVQLGALPGSSRYAGGRIDVLLGQAVEEAEVLATQGVDALMVQNLGDLPVASQATCAQVAWMTRITAEIRSRFGRPVGLNLLENDAEAMFAIASAAEADFVRIKVYVGAMMTPFGMETAQAHTAIRARNACDAANVAIFADVHDRTGNPVASGGFAEDLDFAVRLGGASAENFAEVVSVADGAIVSSSLKDSSSAFGKFDPAKVKAFMEEAKRVQSRSERTQKKGQSS
jgi:uncharacterized protein